MRVACISHGSIVPLNRRPFDLLAARHGVDLTMIVPDRWIGDLPDPDLRYEAVPGGARAIALPALKSGNGSLFMLRGMARAIESVNPELLLVDEEPWSLACWQALRARTRAPVLFYTKQNIAKRLPPPFSWLRRSAYRRAARAWAVGETTREVLGATGFNKPVDLVPHGVEVSRFQPGRDEERRRELGLEGVVIGYAGRFVEEKGITDLLEAVGMLVRQQLPPFTLLLAGTGPIEADIYARAGALDNRVRIIPAVPHDEAPGLYRLMDVCAVPSRVTPAWREQFGRVLVEAAATALPIVAAGTGEIPHVMRDLGGGGRVVPGRDPAALAAALAELIAETELRLRIGAANLSAAREKFSQEAIAARMAELLSDVARCPLPAAPPS